MAKHPVPRTARRSLTALTVVVLAGLVAEVPAVGAQESPGSGGSSGDTTSTSTTSTTTVPGGADERAAEASVASLHVDRAAVRAQLNRAAAARNRQHDRWALSQLASDAAKKEVDRSTLVALDAQRKVLDAQQRVRDYAVQAFMSPPAGDSLAVLSVGDAEAASRAHDLISITADDQRRVVDELADAEVRARRTARAAADAASEAAERVEQSRAELEALEESVREQQRLSEQIDQRLDSALAEVAALREVDERAAEEMKDAELALASDSKAAAGGDRSTGGSGGGGGRSVASGGGSRTTPKPAPPTTPRPTRPPSTTPPGPPPSPPSGVVGWSDVTKVGTFWVHRSIASNVRGLLSAASAAGFNLTGGGFRDPASQIELRRQHCGGTYYDIYQKPASQCSPPTAIPGRSMHEQGKALDIKSGGALIRSRSNPAFQWLAANASRFGLYNLPSEPWHWSVNGS